MTGSAGYDRQDVGCVPRQSKLPQCLRQLKTDRTPQTGVVRVDLSVENSEHIVSVANHLLNRVTIPTERRRFYYDEPALLIVGSKNSHAVL